MATRNLTSRFENFRTQLRPARREYDYSLSDHDESNQTTLLGSQNHGVNMALGHSLPPEWVDIVEDIQKNIGDITKNRKYSQIPLLFLCVGCLQCGPARCLMCLFPGVPVLLWVDSFCICNLSILFCFFPFFFFFFFFFFFSSFFLLLDLPRLRFLPLTHFVPSFLPLSTRSQETRQDAQGASQSYFWSR